MLSFALFPTLLYVVDNHEQLTQHSISKNSLTLSIEPHPSFRVYLFASGVSSLLSMRICTRFAANRSLCNNVFVQTQWHLRIPLLDEPH